MTSARNQPRSHAFTITELMVVIAVILLLIGLLVPSLRSAREASRSLICVTQLRDIGKAFESYKVDHRELYPFADDSLDIPHGRVEPVAALSAQLAINPPAPSGPDSVTPASPWRCPSDPLIAARYGSSYKYELWPLFTIYGPEGQTAASRFVARTGQVAIMREALTFHSPSSDPAVLAAPTGRHYLRADGAVITTK